MSSDGFRRIVLPTPGPQAPCLLRGVFYAGLGTDPTGLLGTGVAIGPERALKTYPTTALYGGPTIYSATQTPMFKEFVRSLGYWAIATVKKWLATEVVFIAPSGFPAGEPQWPHTGWRWWYAQESQPEPVYQLAQTSPTHYTWKQAPSPSWYRA